MNNEKVIKTRIVQINRLSKELCLNLRKNRSLREIEKERYSDLIDLNLMVMGVGKDLNKFIRRAQYLYTMNYDDDNLLDTLLKDNKLLDRLTSKDLKYIINEIRESASSRGFLLPGDLNIDLLDLLDKDIASDRHRCLVKLSPDIVESFRGKEFGLGTGVANEIQRRLCNYANNLASRYREINYVKHKTIYEDGFVNLYIVSKNYPTIDREVSDEPRYYVGLGTYNELEKDNFRLLPDVKDVYVKSNLMEGIRNE
ncbi:hypothetical protein UT300012_24530 [Paraclostridium bifermentans]